MASFLSDRFCHYLVYYLYFSYYCYPGLCTWLASFLSVLFSRTSLSRARVWSRSPGLLYDLRNLCSEFSTQPCHLDGTCFCKTEQDTPDLEKLNHWRSWHRSYAADIKNDGWPRMRNNGQFHKVYARCTATWDVCCAALCYCYKSVGQWSWHSLRY